MSQWIPVLAPTFMFGLAGFIIAMLGMIDKKHQATKAENKELQEERAADKATIDHQARRIRWLEDQLWEHEHKA